MFGERHRFERESDPIATALNVLVSDFRLVDNGIALESIMQRYLADDLAIDEPAACIVWDTMRQAIQLDDGVLYDTPSMAVDYCRTLLVTEVMPLYRNLHSAERFRRWLPIALQVAISPDGNHNIEVCPREWEDFDTLCSAGCCPVKSLTYTADQEVYGADFQSVEYMINPEKEHQNIMTLITEMRRRLIIGEGEEYRLRRCYERRFADAFTHIGNSTLRTGEKPV